MAIPPRAILQILGRAKQIDLWDSEPSNIEPGSAADTLWLELENIDGIGWVIAGKLLARKRPRLFPVSTDSQAISPSD